MQALVTHFVMKLIIQISKKVITMKSFEVNDCRETGKKVIEPNKVISKKNFFFILRIF